MALADDDLRHANALANKVDGIKFAAEVHQIEASINHSVASLRAEMQSGFDAMNLKLAAGISKLDARIDTKIAECQAEMMRWMFIFRVGQVAATVSIVKLLK